MQSITNGAIVVGVTGNDRETAAMQFAAECAQRVGAEVVLAHAFHAEAAGEHAEATQQGLLRGYQKLIAPVERSAQRLMTAQSDASIAGQ